MSRPTRAREDKADIVLSSCDTIDLASYSSAFSAATNAFFSDDLSDGTSRRKVEQRIHELMSEVCALMSCLNTATCTGRLPPEILSRILLDAKKDELYPHRLSWTRPTHICRHWRAVALSCPALWSYIVVRNEAWVKCMLHRSKGAPFCIDLDSARAFPCTAKSFEAVLHKISAHSGRFHSVKLATTDAAMLSNFPKAVPQLQELELRYHNKDETKSHLPAHNLQEGAPKLEHLTITGFTIPWTAIPSPLKLSSIKIEQHLQSNRLRLVALGHSVGQMSGLQKLEIANFLPSGASPPPPCPILIPNLHSLTMHGELAPLSVFFQTCTAFQAEPIHLTIRDISPNIETIGTCFARLAALWEDPGTNAYRSQTGIQGLVLEGLHFKKWGPRTETLAPQVLSSFAEAFDLSPIRWLTVAVGNCYCLEPAWRGVIAPLPNLEHIQFSVSDILGFTSVLDDP